VTKERFHTACVLFGHRRRAWSYGLYYFKFSSSKNCGVNH